MKRSKFNLSHYHLLSFDLGDLVPVQAIEVLPGDAIQAHTGMFLRFQPQLKPLMHPVIAHIHHFFVPNRLVWSGWEDFITGESATPPPDHTGAAHSEGSLYDYLGLYNDASTDISALPIRAFNLIYNTYYLDQDLDTPLGDDQTTIPKVRWEKDYFTTARPWAQKGTAVTIPLGSSAPLTHDGTASGQIMTVKAPNIGASDYNLISGTPTYLESSNDTTGATRHPLYADLSNATGADIRDFREALAMQRYQEARARYGSNYVDYLAYLGVNAGDARLQRPEYLGGGRQLVSFSEVLNTASNAGTDALGELGGHGVAAMRTNTFRAQFQEHGWLMSLAFVRPKNLYVQSCPRKYTKTTKEDYYQKELADVGAQEVLNREVYAPHTTPDGTFGFSNRYAEYFSEQNRVSAEFRNSKSYDWHFGRIFSSDPALNSTFVECDPSKRVFAEQTNHSIWAMANNQTRARRICRRSAVGRLS